MVAGPRRYEREAIERFVMIMFHEGETPDEGTMHAVALYLKRAFLVPPEVPKARTPYYLDKRFTKRWRMSAEVRALILREEVASANAAFERVGERFGASASTVSRAFSEVDGFANLATNLDAFRAAVRAAALAAQRQRRRASKARAT